MGRGPGEGVKVAAQQSRPGTPGIAQPFAPGERLRLKPSFAPAQAKMGVEHLNRRALAVERHPQGAARLGQMLRRTTGSAPARVSRSG